MRGSTVRHLKAIEIAEGALLADIAVVCQLMAVALPVGASLFHVLTYIIFALLVLRRGVYVGIVAVCVTFVLVGIVSGPARLLSVVLQGSGGVFLGCMMARQRGHQIIILSWVCISSFYLWVLGFLISFLAGLHITDMIHSLHADYNAVLAGADVFFVRVGLADWWRREMHLLVTLVSDMAFTYWWLTMYVLLWMFMFPVVVMVYTMTNTVVRFLGCDVRPFLDDWTIRRLQRTGRFLYRWLVRKRLKGRKSSESYDKITTH
jgi:hypothetical protein